MLLCSTGDDMRRPRLKIDAEKGFEANSQF